MGRESLWAELRLLVRREDNLCTPGDSSSVQKEAGAGPGGNRKEEQKLTQERGQRHRSKGKKPRTLIRSLKEEEGKRVRNAPAED